LKRDTGGLLLFQAIRERREFVFDVTYLAF